MRRQFGSPCRAAVERRGEHWVAFFEAPVRFDHVQLREQLTDGQPVREHAVTANGVQIAQGRMTGVGRLHFVGPQAA